MIDCVIIRIEEINKYKCLKQRKNRFEVHDVKIKRKFININEFKRIK